MEETHLEFKKEMASLWNRFAEFFSDFFMLLYAKFSITKISKFGTKIKCK